MTTDLRVQLQALIGPEEEWPDEVKRLVKLLEEWHDLDIGFVPAIAEPDINAALLAVAGMVAFEHERAEAYRELTKEPQP